MIISYIFSISAIHLLPNRTSPYACPFWTLGVYVIVLKPRNKYIFEAIIKSDSTCSKTLNHAMKVAALELQQRKNDARLELDDEEAGQGHDAEDFSDDDEDKTCDTLSGGRTSHGNFIHMTNILIYI